MPKVPTILAEGQTADPFGTKSKDKDQSRMPQGSSFPAPSQAELLMAAAAMHQMGKFQEEAK